MDLVSLDTLVNHLANKVSAQASTGATTVRLKVSPETARQFSGHIGFKLQAKLSELGLTVSIRQWTGEGHSGVLKIDIDPNL